MTSLLRTTTSRPGRRAFAPVAVAVAAGMLLGGCSFTSRNLTLEPYAPSDGLQTDLGDLLVRNILVVSEGGGAPGVISAAVVNRGDADAVLVLEVGGSVSELEVGPSETLFLGPTGDQDGETVLVEAVDTVAGGVVEVRLSDPASDSATLEIPVVLPQGPYAEITPPAGTGADDGSGEDPGTLPSADPGALPSDEPSTPSGDEPSTPSRDEPSAGATAVPTDS